VSFSGAYSQETLKTEGTQSAASDAGADTVHAMFLQGWRYVFVSAVVPCIGLVVLCPLMFPSHQSVSACVLRCADCSQIGVAYWVANNSEIRTRV
jgi:hypothetical protein